MQDFHTPAAAPSRAQRLAALGHTLMERLETPLFVTDARGAVLEANRSEEHTSELQSR